MTAPSLYQRLKQRGVSMDWYDNAARKRPQKAVDIPLDDNCCGSWSIYFRAKDGSLWTVDSNGRKHSQVRPADPSIVPDDLFAREYYVCVCCKAEWDHMPTEHKSLNTQTEQANESISVNTKVMQEQR